MQMDHGQLIPLSVEDTRRCAFVLINQLHASYPIGTYAALTPADARLLRS